MTKQHHSRQREGVSAEHQLPAPGLGEPDAISRPSNTTAGAARRRNDVPWASRIVGESDVPPEELIANLANWRRHPQAQRAAIAAALGTVGWVQRVIWNRRTGHLLDGHARVEEARARGEASVPVVEVDLSEEEEQLVLATLDPLGAMAEADTAMLTELLAGVTPPDEALAAMLAELADRHSIARRTRSDPDRIPPPPTLTELHVQPGELYRLGEHRLLCGDATDPTAVARLFAGEMADCLWADPPVGVRFAGRTGAGSSSADADAGASDPVLLRALRIAPLRPNGRFYIGAPAGPGHAAFLSAIAAVGWELQVELVWSMGRLAPGSSDYRLAHQPILYGYAPGPARPGRGRHAGRAWYGDKAQGSVLAFRREAADRDHARSQPVGLVEQCLRNSTTPGDLVYDPFLGSGTTLIAAERLGRRCLAMEIEPRSVQVAIERWTAFTGEEAARDG
jgi:hypothetical protein